MKLPLSPLIVAILLHTVPLGRAQASFRATPEPFDALGSTPTTAAAAAPLDEEEKERKEDAYAPSSMPLATSAAAAPQHEHPHHLLLRGGAGVCAARPGKSDGGVAPTARGEQHEASSTGGDRARSLRTAAAKSSLLNPLQVVFLVDESGSMKGSHDALRRSIPALFGQLQSQAPGSRMALLGFGEDTRASPVPSPHLHAPLTSDLAAFQAAAAELRTRTPAGGSEPGYQSLIEVANGGRLRVGFKRGLGYCVALFADEPSNGDCRACTRDAAVSALLDRVHGEAGAPGVFFGVTGGAGTYASYQPVAAKTRGEMLPLQSFLASPAALLGRIVARCSYLINQITLSPPAADRFVGDRHVLTVRTHRLQGTTVLPQSGVPFELTVVKGGPPLAVRGRTGPGGSKEVAYDPYKLQPGFAGGTVRFRACRRDGAAASAGPPPCATSTATFANRCHGVACPSRDACRAAGACSVLTGLCEPGPILPDGSPCDDADPCTLDDSCLRGTCRGTAKACPSKDECHAPGACDPLTGACLDGDPLTGNPCDDGLRCTFDDACVQGACQGKAKVCRAKDECHAPGTCDPLTGACADDGAPLTGTPCDDGKPCTLDDACNNGACEGRPVACPARDECHAPGTCDPLTGACSAGVPLTGKACDDGNPCTTNDACNNGVCEGTPKVCPARDECHAPGTCDPLTGACSASVPLTGKACDDGLRCTINDACNNGVCEGTPKVCRAKNECHAPGTCDPLTGVCTADVPLTGKACDDGLRCTINDACNNGVCEGRAIMCDEPGACRGPGSCDSSTGQCAFPVLADGAPCEDGNPCTAGDFCRSGTCVHGSVKACNNVCFDSTTFGVDALCVDNCGQGTGTNCQTVCEYFGVPYFSDRQCRNAGSAKDSSGTSVVGNQVCKDNLPGTVRTTCCTCDKFGA